MNPAFFSSARMILLECHESPALIWLLLIETPVFEWYVVRWLKERTPKRHVFKRNWSACSQCLTILGSIVNIIGGPI